MVCSMLLMGALLGRGWAPREGTPGGPAHGAGQLLLQGCLQVSGVLGIWCLAKDKKTKNYAFQHQSESI